MAKIIDQLIDKIPWLRVKNGLNIPNDLEVRGTELLFNDRNELDYLLFQVIEREGGKNTLGIEPSDLAASIYFPGSAP